MPMAKTIVEKLNLHKYERVAVLDLPAGADYLTELPDYDTELIERAYDLIFACLCIGYGFFKRNRG